MHGALYSPTDGTIDPTGVVMAYAKAGRSLGVQVAENIELASIDTEHVDLAGFDGVLLY